MKTLTAISEIEETARLLGWSFSRDGDNVVMWRGAQSIQARLSVAGGVVEARRYKFFRVDDLRLEGIAHGKNKRTTVVAWLAADW